MSEALIYFYQGGEGPTIRIDAISKKWLGEFKRAVYSLIKGTIHEFRIDKMDNVAVCNLVSISLKKVLSKKNVCVSESKRHFTWLQTKNELYKTLGLIDALFDDCEGGTKFLNFRHEYIIELVLNERGKKPCICASAHNPWDSVACMVRAYPHSHIIEITQEKVLYKDYEGSIQEIDLLECRNNWVDFFNGRGDFITFEGNPAPKITISDSTCIGSRNLFAIHPYFEFFTIPNIRFEIHARKKWIDRFNRSWWRRYSDPFNEIREALELVGWTTFDMG